MVSKLQNRKEVLNLLKNPAKARNVIYISHHNSLAHELAKTTFFYLLKKGYSVENIEYLFDKFLSKELINLEEQINQAIENYNFKRKYQDILLLTEAEVGRFKIDLLIADTKHAIEIDHMHKTKLYKYNRLRELFKVSIVDLNSQSI